MISIEETLKELSESIKREPNDCKLRLQRAIMYYKMSQLHNAYNDIAEVLRLEPDNSTALHYSKLLEMVMNFEYRENYNV
ncbi:MAG: hypothetical protein R3Y04_00535 [Rikenellaceae bacterium]